MKLIIEEPETRALKQHLDESPGILATSRIALVEVGRATAIANPAPEVRDEVDTLLSSCLLIAVSAPLLQASRRIASSPVRTLDAIHLASALRIEADELLAYDVRLLAAAAQHGLRTVSPARR